MNVLARTLGVALTLALTLVTTSCTGDSSAPGSSTQAPTGTGAASGLRSPSDTPVPAPGGGDVSVTVTPTAAPSPVKTALNKPATPVQGITVRITKADAIRAVAQGPGEVSGPAVAVTVEIDNQTASAFDSSLVSVTLDDARGLPGSGMIGRPADWITGSVAPGKRVTGVYVFAVPPGNRRPIRVTVSAHPDLPVVVFTGNV